MDISRKQVQHAGLVAGLPGVITVDTNTTASEQSQGSNQTRWFVEEVQPHESALRAYLRNRFPSIDADDVVQESYLRILRAKAAGSLRSVQGFLFTTARNLAFDVFRRHPTASIDTVVDSMPFPVFIDDAPGIPEAISRRQELAFLADAIEALPRRCRRVMKLRKIYGLSHEEIALRLGISENTVSAQVGKGMHACIRYLRAHGVERPCSPRTEDTRDH